MFKSNQRKRDEDEEEIGGNTRIQGWLSLRADNFFLGKKTSNEKDDSIHAKYCLSHTLTLTWCSMVLKQRPIERETGC